jgi:hypothetical protein
VRSKRVGSNTPKWLLSDHRDQSHFGMGLTQERALMIGAWQLRERAQRLCWSWSRSKNDLQVPVCSPTRRNFKNQYDQSVLFNRK